MNTMEKIVEMPGNLLQVDGLTFSIGDSQILNGVTFRVGAGETVGIIGPNGSGKTTLFNCLSGFGRVSGGKITLHGKDVTHFCANQRAKLGIGRVFQNFGIFREMTVLENVVMALESLSPLSKTLLPWGKTQAGVKAKAMEFLQQVNLAGKARDKAGSLSGGQMRLLEIIRTVAFGSDVFLLDEPTAGVSPKMKEAVSELIIFLKSLGKTVLIIEHDINFIQRFAERIIVLDSGKVVLDGAPEQVRESELLQEIYFGAVNA